MLANLQAVCIGNRCRSQTNWQYKPTQRCSVSRAGVDRLSFVVNKRHHWHWCRPIAKILDNAGPTAKSARTDAPYNADGLQVDGYALCAWGSGKRATENFGIFVSKLHIFVHSDVLL